MTLLLLTLLAWRWVRRLAATVILVALAMMLVNRGSTERHGARPTVRAVERVVLPIERDLKEALGRTVRR